MASTIVAHNRMRPSAWQRRPFYLHIQTLFMALIFIIGAALIASSYLQGQKILLSAAENLFDRIERESSGEILHLRAPVEAAVEWISSSQITDAGTFEARMQSLPVLVSMLNRQSRLESLYVGYYNGDFFQVHALRNDADRKTFDAPRHATFRVQSIERSGGGRVSFILLDSALNEISRSAAPPDYAYDPRVRPWFIESLKGTDLVQTDPYVFFTTRQVGQTIAQRAEHGRAVVGADLTLTQLSQTLAQTRPTPSSQLAIFMGDHSVIAYSEPDRISKTTAGGKPALPKIADLTPVLALGASDVQRYAKRQTIDVAGSEWLLQVVPGATQGGQKPAYLAIAVPSDELLTAARSSLQRHLWLTLGLVLLTIPFTWWISRRIANNLKSLTEHAATIRRLDFTAPPQLRTRVKEIFELGEAMGQMRETIRTFLDITKTLSAEPKLDRLNQRVLEEAQAAAGAEGSVVYLLDDSGALLKPAAQTWQTPASAGLEMPPDLAMTDLDNPVVRAAASSTMSASQQLGTQRRKAWAFLDAHFGAAPVMLVTVPLLNRTGAAIGILCLYLPGNVEPPSPERLALVEAFVSAGAVAIDNQRLSARLALEREAAARAAGELEAARRIQSGILPTRESAMHEQRVEIFAYMRAAREVGGDLYDFFPMTEDRFLVLVGDVSGKGLGAAMFMAVSKALAKSWALRTRAGPAELMTMINTEISRDNSEQMFVTLVIIVMDLRTGELQYCNAGHEPPLLLRRAGETLTLDDGGGPPLCVVDDFPYEEASVTLQARDTLAIVSDGITEAMNNAGALYGREPLKATLESPAWRDVDLSTLGNQVLAEVKQFEAGAEPSDDQTLVLVCWRGPA